MDLLDNKEMFTEQTPSFVIMKSDSVWTKQMDMKVNGAESQMVAINVVH